VTVTELEFTATELEFTATENATLTPKFTYTGTTMEYYVDGVLGGTLASGADGSIVVTTGQVVVYKKPDGWSGVTYCNLSDDKISGNIGQFTTLTSLTLLYLYSTSVTASANCLNAQILMTTLQAYDCNWTETEVNACLASLVINEAAGLTTRDCTVTIDGNNAIPSAAGLADVATLEDDKGWTVTVTE
jgi:hypothetical protein